MTDPTQVTIPVMVAQQNLSQDALTAYIAGNAANITPDGSVNSSVLAVSSSNLDFTTATSNYFNALSAFNSANTQNLDVQSRIDIANEIVKNYDYVGVDKTGNLVLLVDTSIYQGGNINISANRGLISYTNNTFAKTDTYQDYTTAGVQSALPPNSSADVRIGNEGIALVRPANDAPLSTSSFVAETVLQTTKAITPATPAAVNDPLTFDAPQLISTAATTVPVSPTGAAYTDQITQTNPARSTSYLEDAATPSNANSVQLAASQNKANTAAQAVAKTQADPNLAVSTPTQTTSNGVITQSPTTTAGPADPAQSTTGSTGSARINPLHNYATYTYKFSLYALPKDKANSISSGQISPGGEESIIQGATLILSSGGSAPGAKGARFKEDFFLDNLVMKSVVGVSARNRATDVVEISFDITEPYNVSLLPRLLATAGDVTGQQDWAMCFYVLRIQFIGYDSNGKSEVIPQTTKYIPFNFTNMEFDIGAKGAVYRCKAVPMNHWAQTQIDNDIPFHLELTGGTIDEIFNGVTVPPVASGGARADETPRGKAVGNTGMIMGISDALNKSEDDFKKNNVIEIPCRYYFKFQGGIGDKQVYDPQEFIKQGFRMSDVKNPTEQLPRFVTLDKDKNTFRVQAGTKITDLINAVMQMSQFYTDQYASPSPKDKPMYLHKIVPSVKFLEYDNLTNMWARETTYNVIPYAQFGNDAEGFGQKPPDSMVKDYKWIYTGKNRDVLDVKFSYKAAFLTLRNGGERAALQEGETAPNPPPAAGDQQPDPGEKPKKGMFPTRIKPVRGLANMSNTGARNVNKKVFSIEELFHKQFDSVGDNIKLDITIVGDPDLIQQDNILYGANGGASPVYGNNAINFVTREVYFTFGFVTPLKDYNDQTGLFQVSDEAAEHFNGKYRITTVTSEFKGGKFTQKLENVRVKNQAATSNAPARSSSGTQAEPATSSVQVSNPAASGSSNTNLDRLPGQSTGTTP